MKKAIYALSADPLTKGHLNIIDRALQLFDEIIIGIGINPDKKYTFTLEERELLAQIILKKYEGKVIVKSFIGLLSDFAYENKITTIIRGARNSTDFDFEHLLKDINHGLQQGIETILYIADQKLSHISSSAAKELVKNQAKGVSSYVPLIVKRSLERRISGQYLIGITGEIACGKSYVAKALCDYHNGGCGMDFYSPDRLQMHNVDVDRIGHEILEEATEEIYVELRKDLAFHFGKNLLKENGMIDTSELSVLLFSDNMARHEFDQMMFEPMSLLLRRKLFSLKGIILLNCALIAEANISDIVNNEVIVVTAPRNIQEQRLRNRGYPDEKIKLRLSAQLTAEKKIGLLRNKIEKDGFGTIIQFENGESNGTAVIAPLYEKIIETMLKHAVK